ncbi:alpha/beta fold hydrolase [Ramlibacter sp.]|uniref:alpha/beta fold hydrolase n=1 Tax=Ramlibacter sp. TaxID=1917967 RepID=UPI003D0A1669
MTLEQGAHVRVNGIRQHYLRFGDGGPGLVIVPGIVSPAILWQHVARRLAANFACYVLDVRGRGLSEAGPQLDYGSAACARDLLEFVGALGLVRPTVIGHSMGARIAVHAAARSPDAFGSLVLVDPPTSGPGRRPYPIPKARTLSLLYAATRGEAMAAIMASPAKPWPEPLQQLRAEWLSTCDERAVHVAYDGFHADDLFADLARTTAPVSLIAAGEGGVISDEDIAEMRTLRTDLHAVRVPGVGHQMQAEDFDTFARVLDECLRRQPNAPRNAP